MRAAFEPSPPDTERTAGVLEELPILTPESKSLLKVSSPEPLGVRVRLELEVVPSTAAEPLPRFKAVAEIPKVAADEKVVNPLADSVVSLASKVMVLLPELRVSVF